jgi:ribonuclease D
MIDSREQLAAFVARVDPEDRIAFDTEFISEGRYRPQLCLIQVATGREMAMIDALAVEDLTPFWELLVGKDREVIVHAGRSEMEFCYLGVGKIPERVFDVQLAAGFVGIEYPAGFRTLVSRLVGIDLPKGETRTDWRRRPLSQRQIEYAINDVRYLHQMAATLQQMLLSAGRMGWYEEEFATLRARLKNDLVVARWRSTSGIGSMRRRELAIVRELWLWRDRIAQERNCPPSRVLRNDLIVEMARRRTADPKRIRAVRGLHRSDLKKHLEAISEAIQKGLDLSEEKLPKQATAATYPQFPLLGQFLFSALGCICRNQSLSSGLVGTTTDIRELAASRLGYLPAKHRPKLDQGWRKEVVGNVVDDLLAGKYALGIADPRDDQPLELFSLEEKTVKPTSP